MPDRRGNPDIIRTATRITFPVVLVLAGEHIVNAAAAPGEGFSAGLLTALSILLLYVGMGYEKTERNLPVFGRWGLITGIGLALFTGFVGFVGGDAFLASFGPHPQVGEETVHLTTHVFFDLAIFFVVSSGTLAIFRALGAPPEKNP